MDMKAIFPVIMGLAGSALVGCKSLKPEMPETMAIPFTVQGEYREEGRNAAAWYISSVAEWESALKSAGLEPAGAQPDVAGLLESQHLILVFAGQQNSGGTQMEVNMRRGPGKKRILISAKVQQPGKNCMVTTAIQYPVALHAFDPIPNVKFKSKFKSEVVDCE
jgi:hypothetical protein